MLSAMGKVSDLIHLLGVSYPTYASLKVGLQSLLRLRRAIFQRASHRGAKGVSAKSLLRSSVEGQWGVENEK